MPATYPLGPFDPAFSPAILTAIPPDCRPTALQYGWIRDLQHTGAIARYRNLRKLTSVEKEIEVLRYVRQGWRHIDIAMELGVATATVGNILKRSMKRATTYAGAENERIHQLEITDRLIARLMASIDPGPDADGYEPRVDTKAVAEIMKVLNRRAAITGADKPVKVHLDGHIVHDMAEETVNKVNEYMDLVDKVMDMGYGSGRKREELEVPEEDRIIDAEVVDEDDAEVVEPEVIPPFVPVIVQSPPNGSEPGGDN